MQIYYVGAGRFPTEKANGYQIAQMLQAFTQAGARASLIHYDVRSAGQKIETPEAIYGLISPLTRVTYEVPTVLTHALSVRGVGAIASKALIRVQAAKAADIIIHSDSEPAVIYTRHPEIASRLLSTLPSAYTRRLCVELHSLPESPKKFAIYIKILKSLPRIVTITAAMRDRLVAAGLDETKILVAHDAVDQHHFPGPMEQMEARRMHSLPIAGKNISYIGRFQTMGQEKGLEEIIKAAAILIPLHSDLYFTLVGGPASAVKGYIKLIESMGLPRERFIFPGYRPVHEMHSFLAAADILLMPMPFTHHYAYNASPLKLFQYLTAGRAIVASDLPSVREIVGNEEAALLPEPGNPTALAESIEKVLGDDALAARLSARALSLSYSYTWQARAQSILNFLN